MLASNLRVWSLRSLAVSCALTCACAPKPIPNNPDASVELAQAPTWQNWSGDLHYAPTTDGENYYFTPTTREELQGILAKRPKGMKVRVSGQRHSQPGLVLANNNGVSPEAIDTWVIDLSCYADLGPSQTDLVELHVDEDTGNGKLTVNAGVREDYIDAFLTQNNLMLNTVTAGGFFSAGGMTAIDVHGATVAAPIFAETVSAFTIMDAKGEVTTIERSGGAEGAEGWDPLQFARVSLGALGIVTSVTIDVLPRPYATSVVAGRDSYRIKDEAKFVAVYTKLLHDHDRVESFYNPYANEFLALWWDLEDSPRRQKQNLVTEVASSCTFASLDKIGAPLEGKGVERAAESIEHHEQFHGTNRGASLMISFAMDVIKAQTRKARRRHSDLWLLDAIDGIFMSYFIEMPAIDAEGLGKVWQGLQAVKDAVSSEFRIAGPLEFRFVRGGDSALAGTYTTTPDEPLFVNLDLIGFVDKRPLDPAEYPQPMLDYFAAVERQWFEVLGGAPHNGKMYGFYDPSNPDGPATAPFNPAFLDAVAQGRADRLEAFERYRYSRDPEGVFCNDYLAQLKLCASTGAAPAPAPAPDPVQPVDPNPPAAEPSEGPVVQHPTAPNPDEDPVDEPKADEPKADAPD